MYRIYRQAKLNFGQKLLLSFQGERSHFSLNFWASMNPEKGSNDLFLLIFFLVVRGCKDP